MPRGNDAVEAARELAARYRTHGNAEDLIQSSRLRRDQLVVRSGLLAEKSAEEVEDLGLDVDKVRSESGNDEVVSFAVRGDYVSYVAEAENGDLYKGAYPIKGSLAEKRLEKDGDAWPKGRGPQRVEDDEREHYQREAEVAAAANEAAVEAEKLRAEAVQKANEKAAEKVQKAAESAQKSAQKSGKSGDK